MSRRKPRAPLARPYALPIPHEHAGVVHPAGAVLLLFPDQIERIEARALAVNPVPPLTPGDQP